MNHSQKLIIEIDMSDYREKKTKYAFLIDGPDGPHGISKSFRDAFAWIRKNTIETTAWPSLSEAEKQLEDDFKEVGEGAFTFMGWTIIKLRIL